MHSSGRVVALGALACVAMTGTALAVDTGRAFAGPARSPHGLELTGFTVSVSGSAPHVGQYATVRFRLANVSKRPVALGDSGIFVAARWSGPGRSGDRDEGFTEKHKTLAPGEVVDFERLVTLDAVGRWSFSPAYSLVGGRGPSPWHALEIDVVEKPREERRLGYCANVSTLPAGIALMGFSVFGPSPLRVGDEVTIEYHLENRAPGGQAISFGPQGVFAVASVEGKERAFGSQLPEGSLAPNRVDRVLAVEARLRLDAPGEWRFRPVVDLGGRQTPRDWCEVAVQASPK